MLKELERQKKYRRVMGARVNQNGVIMPSKVTERV